MLKAVKNLAPFCVSPDCTVRDALLTINQNSGGFVVIVDGGQTALATLTDGDLRRAILNGHPLSASVSLIISDKKIPIIALSQMATINEQMEVMRKHQIRHLPLLDDKGHLQSIVTADILTSVYSPPKAVIMAGGFGKRLYPLTQDIPKPMLPVGDRPILEHIVEQIREADIQRISVSTFYKSEKIIEHFQDGKKFGVEIDYISEKSPLGTAGALSLLENVESTLLVINGDVLTRADFRAMVAFHREHSAVLTVGVRQYDIKVPYGVVEGDGWQVKRLSEKPEYHFFVNVGIYLVEPEALRFLPKAARCDMTELIESLLAAELPIANFPVVEYWLDIGRPDDYEKAQDFPRQNS